MGGDGWQQPQAVTQTQNPCSSIPEHAAWQGWERGLFAIEV
jgi:hypothetical protein